MLKKIWVFVLFLLLVLSAASFALQFETANMVVIPEDKVIQDNLFVAGDKIYVAGTVKGDLLAFGGQLYISGDITGNVIAAGGEVNITGSAKNIFVSGGEVLVNGVVKQDLLVGGGDIYFGKNARVGRDLYVGSGSVNISGKVYRNLKVGAGSLVIAPTAKVKGTLDYSARYSNISKQAPILGEITTHAVPDYGERASNIMAGVVLTREIVGIITILLLGILAIVFLPNQVKLVTSTMTKEFWKSLGVGVLSLIVIPLIIFLLIVTLIGLPIGILLLIAYIFGIYITGIFTSVVIGQWIFKKIGKPGTSLIWALILGFIIFKVLGWVPIVGWIFSLIVFLWAFGALISTRFTTYKEAREKGIV
jgi:cytoskeletal protein CcmA (bactofilin family)